MSSAIFADESAKAASIIVAKAPVENRRDVLPEVNNENNELAILGTAEFRILLPNGQYSRKLRGICDSGAQIHLLTEHAVQQLGLMRIKQRIPIAGIGETTHAKGYLDVTIGHRSLDTNIVTTRVHVINRISTSLPDMRFDNPFDSSLQSDQLADPVFNIPGPIDALLGIGVWSSIVEEQIMRHTIDGQMFLAQRTSLGWVISGRTFACKLLRVRFCLLSVSNVELDLSLQKFWECESIPGKHILTPDEQLAETIFVSTHNRDQSGRYIVTIPMKPNSPTLGNSRITAIACFRSLERKFARSADLFAAYKAVMDDYRQKGHLMLAPPASENDSESYVMPHHAINPPGRPDNKGKFRVVYNASAATTTGISYNDCQLAGYKLQDHLCDIFLRFRMKKFAATADIAQMYRQVKVHPDYWNFQRIVWRDSPNEPLREYVITIVTWGSTSASFNAIRAIRQCANDHEKEYPIGAVTVLSDFYHDDGLFGRDTEEDLVECFHQTTNLLACGGFNLTKWSTNSKILAHMVEQDTNAERSLPTESGVLGMKWLLATDQLCFKVQQSEIGNAKITKRFIVSRISQIYDPSGVIAPVIVSGKLIIKRLWQSGVDWDEIAPSELIQTWKEFNININSLNDLQIPRWIGAKRGATLQLHVFADASEEAYGAVAYIRAENEDGSIVVNILTAKSRVVPLQKPTIPRLELLAAEMASRLAAYVRSACHCEFSQTYLWSDSQIVIYWLRRDPGISKLFVSNHVRNILANSPNAIWQHVNGIANPADLISRGTTVEQLAKSTLWLHGPHWLSLPMEKWPKPSIPALTCKDKQVIEIESKPKKVALAKAHKIDVLSVRLENGSMQPLIERRSTLNSVLRITAYVYRYKKILRARVAANRRTRKRQLRNNKVLKKHARISPVLPAELDNALLHWIGVMQREYFPREVNACLNSEILPKESQLVKLRPKIDGRELLYVGGRLSNADIPEGAKHQYIVPADSPLAMLLIQRAHFLTLHGTTGQIMTHLRQRFWILRMRQAVRKVVDACVTCLRFHQRPNDQLMADLPVCRVTQSEPFSRTGIDFAGPFRIKAKAGRPPSKRNVYRTKAEIRASDTMLKAWITVFTCMATRAIHLDVIVGLSTEEFMAAFARFVNRRGRCFELYSDNGTSFVGTNNELSAALVQWSKNVPNHELSKYQTEWRFITPAAPHHGGAWESMVKRVKFHMRRVIGDRILTRDQLYTTMTQIEGCVNSRPLWPMTDDPTDLLPVTPAHLIIGKPILPQPLTGDLADLPENRLTMWGSQQKLEQHFWKRWHEEYLVGLQERNKWYRPKNNLKIGDMVILRDENLPPVSWAIGRVTAVFPGADGFVRSVTIKTPTSELNRPVQKLCVLPPAGSSPQADDTCASVDPSVVFP